MDQTNYSMFAIPASYLVAFIPHVVKGVIISSNVGKYNNVNPRTQLDAYKEKMTKAAHQKALRAAAAHQNGLEAFPLFAAAVIAGNVAGLPTATLNAYSGAFLAARFLYNLIYINNTSPAVAGLRTLVWASGVGACVSLLVQAAKAKM
ncbi:hypothetical protein HK104_001032 [Borealophlyctis nickersoniae]|nr:hypothetical protein HK104_001032 [Borealophlyctis nickersoniae]